MVSRPGRMLLLALAALSLVADRSPVLAFDDLLDDILSYFYDSESASDSVEVIAAGNKNVSIVVKCDNCTVSLACEKCAGMTTAATGMPGPAEPAATAAPPPAMTPAAAATTTPAAPAAAPAGPTAATAAAATTTAGTGTSPALVDANSAAPPAMVDSAGSGTLEANGNPTPASGATDGGAEPPTTAPPSTS